MSTSAAPRLEPEAGLTFHDVISADGTRLRAWTNNADGPVVLLCNGLGTNAWCWPALLDPACGVRVISWNHRGTGGSERPADPGRIGVDSFVEDALAVLDDAGVSACPLLGWSIGVNTMFELAVRHPDRVTGMCAVAGVPGDTFASMLAPLHVPRLVAKQAMIGFAHFSRTFGSLASPVVRRLPESPGFLTALTHSGFMLPTPDGENTRRALREFLATPVEWYARLALASSEHLRVSLSHVRVPCTFVAGAFDVLAGSADLRTAAERIPDARYTELRGSHFLPLEQPDVVHQELLDLLSRVR